MNEELQKELLSILRAMKDGTPAAFDALVQQRVLYCWANAVPLLVAALVCAAFAVRCWRIASPEYGKYILEQQPVPLFGGTIGLVLFGAIGLVTGCVGFSWAAEAIAPLGRVLEALR